MNLKKTKIIITIILICLILVALGVYFAANYTKDEEIVVEENSGESEVLPKDLSESQYIDFWDETRIKYQSFRDFDAKAVGELEVNFQSKKQNINTEIQIDADKTQVRLFRDEESAYIYSKSQNTYFSGKDREEWYFLSESSISNLIGGNFNMDTNSLLNIKELILEMFENEYEYLGSSNCKNTKCNVFRIDEGNGEFLLYINQDSNLVERIEILSQEAKGDFELSYEEQNIKEPINIETLDGLSLNLKLVSIFLPVLGDNLNLLDFL